MAEYDGVNTDTSSYSGISVITINRPDRKNAVDPLTAKALYQAILVFEDDPKQKVCVLTGAGSSFCAGADLHSVAQSNSDTPGDNLQPIIGHNLGPMGPSRLIIKKPVICAISGYAVAGGLELSLLADMRVVEEDAVFGVFCRAWSCLGYGINWSAWESLKEAIRIARQLITFPELCLNTDRQSCYYSAYEASSFQDAISQEFNAGSKVISQEAIAGAAKFSKGSGRHGSFKDHNKL
ncbi:hypothetical protein LT330_004083 [Penicillium expansum]|nr:hypothetical protein LT330_004083 [Penicillium expansum]